jgi:hypothetical protein
MRTDHSFTYGVFLLARAARSKPHRDVAEWIDAARAPDSHLSSVDLRRPADTLMELDLAWPEHGRIAVHPTLLELCDTDNHATLRSIVRMVLSTRPPQWLRLAVTSAGVTREYLPADELTAMAWLEPDLDQILMDIWRDVGTVDRTPLLQALDAAAERMVFAALAHAGAEPLHVAQLSNNYGYDIEVRSPSLSRIEVKAAGTAQKGSFTLTRNEFDNSQRYGSEWRLWQVIFSSAALVADTLNPSHVEGVLELTSEVLSATVPTDLPGFVWTHAAYVTPPHGSWHPAPISLNPDFTTAGFQTLRDGWAEIDSLNDYTR